MRLGFLFAPLPLLVAGACGLESGGLTTGPEDAATDSRVEDRGIGMTDSGSTCICVPPPPGGWTYVAYEVDLPDAGTGCTGDFGKQTYTKETSGGAAPTCACNCMPAVTPSCATDKATLTIGDGNTCMNGATYTNITPDVNGCYNNQDFGSNISDWFQGTATFKVNGTCTPMETNNIPPRSNHTGQACAFTGGLGSGCMTPTDQCVPKVPAGFLQCVETKGAMMPCPAGFPNAHRVGEGVNDDRGCSACVCTPAATCTGTFEARDNDNCNTGATISGVMQLDNVCRDSTQNHQNIKSFRIAAITSAPTCTKSGNMPQGSVSVAMERTICCQ